MAGFGIDSLRRLLPELRGAKGQNDLTSMLAEPERHLRVRSRALLRAAAQLNDLIGDA